MRASVSRPGAPFSAASAATKPFNHHHRSVSAAAKGGSGKSNPFAKLGTQFAKVGSQLSSLTGTAKVSRRGSANDNVVFIAGATGRLGYRILKQALEAGFRVRAGCRSKEKGEDFLAEAKEEGLFSRNELGRVQLVEFDLFDAESIESAIGNAGVVISAIGAPESKPFDVSGPKNIDGEGQIRLIDTAATMGVKRFIMVTSLGTTKFGWPASALNLFWGILYWKAQSERALMRSGMAYTIVRPGGMERPGDDYKETHSTVLAPRDTYFGNQISRLQVAEVVGACLAEPELASNKTLEAVALEEAPPRDLEDLLTEIEPEISLEEMRERQARIADVRKRLRGLEGEAERLEEQLAAAEERKVNAEAAFSAARGELQEIQSNSRDDLRAAEQAEQQLEQLQAQLEAAKRQEEAAKAVLSAQRTAGRDGEVLSRNDIRAISQPILNPPAEGEEQAAAGGRAGGGGGFFGSLLGGGAKRAAEEAEDAAEEVEEEIQEAPRKAAFGFGNLFGGAKAAAQDTAAEVEQEAEQAAPAATKQAKRGFGGLFGGAKDAAAEAEAAAEETAQAAPPQAKRAARQAQSAASGAAKQAKGAAKEAAQEVEKAAEQPKSKTIKGGGLFGMFQQDTVYAGEGGDSSGSEQPSPEQVDRAVTKRGMGKRKPRYGGAQAAASQAGDAAKSVQKGAEKAAGEAKQQAPKAAEQAEKAAQGAARQAGGGGGFFSGLQKAFEDLSAPPPPSKSQQSSTPSASSGGSSGGASASSSGAAAAKGSKQSGGGGGDTADRRAKAIGSALKSLESASNGDGKAASSKGGDGKAASSKGGASSGSGGASSQKAEVSASPAKRTAKGEPSQNGAAAYPDGKDGANAWIKQWRQKQKA